jgi:hypothetical protein
MLANGQQRSLTGEAAAKFIKAVVAAGFPKGMKVYQVRLDTGEATLYPTCPADSSPDSEGGSGHKRRDGQSQNWHRKNSHMWPPPPSGERWPTLFPR